MRRLQGGGACARVRSVLSLEILLALAPVLVSVLTGCVLELGLAGTGTVVVLVWRRSCILRRSCLANENSS